MRSPPSIGGWSGPLKTARRGSGIRSRDPGRLGYKKASHLPPREEVFMFKGHPIGLFALGLSNMGERFGYYTVVSIFTLFMGAKFGWTDAQIGNIWGLFVGTVYGLVAVGGFVADKIGYGKTVIVGIVTMMLGYALMAVPASEEWFVYLALGVIALGTGLFKGNLVVLLGKLYEQPEYKKLQDPAFNIYYMGINVGAFFAPYAAAGVRKLFLSQAGFTYDPNLPGMANRFLEGKLENAPEYLKLAQAQVPGVTDLTAFSHDYLAALTNGYHAGWGIAALSVLLSLGIYFATRRTFQHADYRGEKKIEGVANVEISPAQFRQRVVALFLVYFVVVFFWVVFQQSGYTLTLFAKNYTNTLTGRLTNLFFDLPGVLSVIFAIVGLVLLLGRGTAKRRGLGAALLAAGAGVAAWRLSGFAHENRVDVEVFQSFNPLFVVFLTPLVVWFFAALNKKNREPSTPKKIAYGMFIGAAAYLVMVGAAFGLASPAALEATGGVSSVLVTPYWLVSTYFTLTVAELFLSPMGMSLVAKVAPPKVKGLMQGFWFAFTGLGNYLSGQVGAFYVRLELWQTFLVLLVACFLAAGLMLAAAKVVERAVKIA
jgi:proton-dependent oligopeptide transporter, POT family